MPGFVPGGSQSVRFSLLASGLAQNTSLNIAFGVFIDGHQLAASDMSDLPGYSIYGVDVANFSGQNVNITFTALQSKLSA